MKQPSVNSTADPEIRVRFQAQLADARETPVLSRLVRRPTADLYPRYSGYYQQLCQLPRRVRWQLQRQWRRSLSAIALLLALGQAPALAANIAVAPGNPPGYQRRWALRPHRGHQQRQCRCPDPQRLRRGQRGRFDCVANREHAVAHGGRQ